MKRGLVFCGGGAKGSYEAGVWKYLDERGEKFDIVTGTSIGCLNAAMYAQHDFERAMELWNRVTLDLIVEDGFNYDENVSIKSTIKERDDLFKFLSSYLKNKGGNTAPLKKIIDDYAIPERIINSDVTFGIVCTQFPSFKGVEVNAKDLTPELLKKYMLASASAFPILQVCKINGNSYIDGGYYDNLPINFALDLGAEDVVAIDLNPNITHKEFLNKPYIKYIHPSWPLGGFMKFENEIMMKNYNLGYTDAKKAYGEYLGFRYTFNLINMEDIKPRKYVIELSRLIAYMKKNKIKSNVKPEIEGDLFHILEKWTTKPLSDLDYYIRSIEVCLEFFSYDHYLIYDLKETYERVVSSILEIEYNPDLFSGFTRIKNDAKKRDFISRMDDKALIRYLYEKTRKSEVIEIEDLANILASKPICLIIYLVLITKEL